LPSEALPADSPELPSKHTVDVLPDGTVLLNGGSTGDPPIGELASLTNLLGSLKASADRLGKKTVVTIQADPFSPHRRSIDVLNACARANLKYVSFAQM
jgi:biopolymer transport protein ExbD